MSAAPPEAADPPLEHEQQALAWELEREIRKRIVKRDAVGALPLVHQLEGLAPSQARRYFDRLRELEGELTERGMERAERVRNLGIQIELALEQDRDAEAAVLVQELKELDELRAEKWIAVLARAREASNNPRFRRLPRANEPVTRGNISKEYLKSIYDAAGLETSWGDDGDLRVKDKVPAWALPHFRSIHLLTNVGFVKGTRLSDMQVCADRITRGFPLIEATVHDGNRLCLSHSIKISQGGMLPDDVVRATRLFLSTVLSAVLSEDVIK
jgi:hypothetical protein